MTTPWSSLSRTHGSASTDVVTLVDGTTFLVGAANGDLAGEGVEGLYMLDTRVLTTWRLTIDDHPIEGLKAIPNGPFSVSMVGRAPALANAESELSVVRRRHVGRGMREDIELRYFGIEPRPIVLAIEMAADFASLLEVKHGHVGEGPSARPRLDRARVRIEPSGSAAVDAVVAAFADPPDRISGDRVEWDIDLEPGRSHSLCVEVSVEVEGDAVVPSHRCGEAVDEAVPVGRLATWRSSVPRLVTDDPAMGEAFAQALEDLGALRIFDPDHAERVVVAAGAPWFMTLFGRDALLTAWMALLVDHDLARGVLEALAENQGLTDDPATDEQAGRILHEVRYDHHTSRLLGGANIYFGTIDATPLFVMLAAELARWSGSIDAIASLLPAVDLAMSWIETRTARHDDGFLRYERSGAGGLANQGWKDSWDGIRYGDGQLAEAPIALCEVQGYVFAAYRGRAQIADELGDTRTARRFSEAADELRRRFEAEFWMPEHGTYALGIDGDGRQIDSIASNVGHCLWTGIVAPERSTAVAELLGSDRFFSGWGLRTVALDSGGYNPLSYHCGSVWPHDTGLAVAGLARYGHDRAVGRLARGLTDAAAAGGGRLPELFAGFDRSYLPEPVPYPASCSPQAWAAASPLLLVRAILGFEPDLLNGTVHVRPRLPAGVTNLAVEDIPLGSTRISIEVSPEGVDVRGLPDGIELIVRSAGEG